MNRLHKIVKKTYGI